MSSETIILGPAQEPATASLIFLHGLGADAHDFEPLVDALDLPGCRYLFPNAPIRPVTLNGGYPMRAWFDIETISSTASVQPEGLSESLALVHSLLLHEVHAGVPLHRILIGGFSQGGAVALAWARQHRDPLLGIVGLSTFLPAGLEQPSRPHPSACPVFLAHGREDTVVPLALAEATREHLLREGHQVTWCIYAMQHEVVAEEIMALRIWLRDRLASDQPGQRSDF